MKFFIFLLFIIFPLHVLGKVPLCPILKTVVKATSLDQQKQITVCDVDTHFVFTVSDNHNPEIILYKKSHETFLNMPVRGTELVILDKNKRYVIRDNDENAYLIEMIDDQGIIIFTELNKNDSHYINRSYILLDRK